MIKINIKKLYKIFKTIYSIEKNIKFKMILYIVIKYIIVSYKQGFVLVYMMLKSLKMIQKCFTNSRNWDTMELRKVCDRKKDKQNACFLYIFLNIWNIIDRAE